jgi:diguanylate cyclase (GGDEF)-like protein
LLASLSDGIVVIRGESLVFANEAAESWLGTPFPRSRDELTAFFRRMGDRTLSAAVRDGVSLAAYRLRIASRFALVSLSDSPFGTIVSLRDNTAAERQATADALTGVANRHEMQRLLELEFERSARGACTGVAVLFIDVDLFKSVNTRYGHQVGDEALKHVASVLRDGIRPLDHLCRYGGEEFVVIMGLGELSMAMVAAERLRKMLEDTPYLLADGTELRLTVSIGVASVSSAEHPEPAAYRKSYPPTSARFDSTPPAANDGCTEPSSTAAPRLGSVRHGEASRRLLRSANMAMQQAKDGGRNRVCS